MLGLILIRSEGAVECAWEGKADPCQHHRRRKGAYRVRVVVLVVMAKPSQQEGEAEGDEEVREQSADDGRPHHLKQPCLQRYHGDNQLREVAEGGVEEAADRGARVRRDLLRALDDQLRERNDGQGCAEEDHPGRDFCVIEKNSDGCKDQEPQE